MNRRMRRLNAKLRALLGVALIVNLSFWTVGCGQMAVELPDGSMRIALTPGHPLTAHLVGTAFEGATAVEIKAGSQEFRFIFADEGRELSGSFTEVNGRPEVASLTMTRGPQSATMQVDPATKCITSITTSTGQSWERPADWTIPQVVGDGANGYLDANRQLIEMAEQFDTEGAFAGTTAVGDEDGRNNISPEKAEQMAFGPLAALFLSFGMVWLYPAGIAAALAWVIQLINLIF